MRGTGYDGNVPPPPTCESTQSASWIERSASSSTWLPAPSHGRARHYAAIRLQTRSKAHTIAAVVKRVWVRIAD
jgi:hypothetical protein